MTKKTQGKDPFADREANRYDQPIASREFILQLIEQRGACTLKQLCKALDISPKDTQQFTALERRTKAMLRDYQLSEVDGKLQTLDKSRLITGKVALHKDGYGFLISADSSEDLYLSFQQTRLVFDGDEVLAYAAQRNHKGKLEAKIVKVLERHTQRIVGKLLVEKQGWRVIPENPKNQHVIDIDKESSVNAQAEQLVVVEITQPPEAYKRARGVIIKVLGGYDKPGIEVDIALTDFAIPHEWPQDVLDQTQSLSDNPSKKDKKGRVDLSHLPFVTIDGEDAKDFDDAVYCQKKKSGGWRLWVAIADVSHYVPVGSALDIEAQKRATSVYFPDYVVPMLPEVLSNGLCSLKPNVDRLSLVCEMTISANGRLSGYQFYHAVIHSHARLTYNEVQQMLLEKGHQHSPARAPYQAIIGAIDELYVLYQALKQQRQLRGAMDFDSVEIQAIFDEKRKIEQLIPKSRNDAHKLIEECMLCANVAAAKYLQQAQIAALYRVHEGPGEKKLSSLREFLAPLGLSLTGGNKPQPSDYQALTQALDGRSDKSIIQTMLLRSMSQALYQADNQGHFGLAYKAYAHFTSPIRRYPDLIVHRLISQHLSQSANKKPRPLYSLEQLVQLGEHCSMAERRADDATRDVLSHLKCEYLQQYIGCQFQGTVQSVAAFGLFIELDDLYSEGLLHVSELDDDFYHYDGKQCLIGERTRTTYRLGDKVQVLIKQVQIEERKVHLSLLKNSKKGFKKRKKTS